MSTAGFYQGEFEVEFLPLLQGSIEAQVYEKGEAPSRIIDINDPWFVEVNWSLTGPLQRFICGTWDVDVYMESIGKGPELELPDEAFEEIPYQIEADPRPTGTDARAMQMGRGGVATGLVSIPLRYMHTPSEVVDLEDVERCVQLLVEFAKGLEKGDYAHW